MERNGILHPWIVGVKCDDIVHSHMDQLLKGQSAVQRFPPCPFVLAAFIQEWHDNIHSSGLSAYCGNDPLQILKSNDPLQILKMIVRRHVVQMTAQRVGQRIVADIHHEIEVVSPDGFLQNTFGFPGAEAGSLGVDEVRRTLIPFELEIILLLVVPVFTPLYNVVVDLGPQLFAALQWNDTQTVKVFFGFLCHFRSA